MTKKLKQRIEKLEQTQAAEHRITRIEIVCAETGEVGAVIHVGEQPSGDEVLEVLKYKHETDPPRKLIPRQA